MKRLTPRFARQLAVGLGLFILPTLAHGGDLEAAVSQAGHREAGDGAQEWLVYSVESAPDQQFVCCHRWDGGTVEEVACRPEQRRDSWIVTDRRPVPSQPDVLRVYLGVEDGRVERVRSFSAGCQVETSWPVTVIENVTQDESLGLLRRVALEASDRQGDDRLDHALATITRHRVAGAVRVLGELSEPGRDADLREQALFWLGQTHSSEAVAILSQRLDGEPSSELREHILFSLSQTGLPEAGRRIRRAAEGDVSRSVRSQGWFWLAQTGDAMAEDAIFEALGKDSSREVRERAVFALSQLPEGRGVEALLKVLRTTDDGEMQRQALFWLAESDDPRALEQISELLASR